MKVFTAKNFPAVFKTVPNEMITMYGRKVIKNKITADTEPILADEKKVDVM